MRKGDLDTYAYRRPFQPFEIRMVDGQRFRFTRLGQLVVGRYDLAALTRKGLIIQVSIERIASIRPIRRPRRRARPA